MKATKESLLKAIKQNRGIVTNICKSLDMARQSFYERLDNDIELQEALEDAREEVLDLGESKLIELVQEGNAQAVFFMLKTIGKNRGYIEKQEVEQLNRTINIIEIPKIDALEPTIDEIREETESEH
jgi:hypothetical protein